MLGITQSIRHVGKLLLILPTFTVTALLSAYNPIDIKVNGEKSTVLLSDTLYKKRFPGGAEAFTKFVSKNIHYPHAAHTANATGKVTVQFQLSPDGTVKNVKLMDAAQEDLGKEVERVLNILPKFQAAHSRMTKTILFSVLFLLEDEYGNRAGPDPAKVNADIIVTSYNIKEKTTVEM